MNEMENQGLTSSPGEKDASTPTNVNRPRSSKICKNCSRSVKNLSRHQKEVHGMSKMRRKLDVYLTGDKKGTQSASKILPLVAM